MPASLLKSLLLYRCACGAFRNGLRKHTHQFHQIRNLSMNSVASQIKPQTVLTKNNVQLSKSHLQITGLTTTPLQLHYIWLRDHCRCSKCYNHATHQRNVDLLSIPLEVCPKDFHITGEELQLTWPDGHESRYQFDWLLEHSHDAYLQRVFPRDRKVWRQLPDDVAHIPVREFLKSEEALHQLMKSLIRYGVGFVEGVEASTEATGEVIERVGPVQRTLFGEVWELKPSEHHEDTAYSTLALGAHTDNTYFTEAAGLQVFHCLDHKGEGGKTLLVDGFRAALDVKSQDRESYDVLTSTSIESEYLESGQHHCLTAPVLRLHPITQKLQQIRFNLYDRAPLSALPPGQDRVLQWYHAMHLLARAVRDPQGEVWLKLGPGTVLFVDNWRVLHGRSAYTGFRWITGGYVARTDYLSRARVAGALAADA